MPARKTLERQECNQRGALRSSLPSATPPGGLYWRGHAGTGTQSRQHRIALLLPRGPRHRRRAAPDPPPGYPQAALLGDLEPAALRTVGRHLDVRQPRPGARHLPRPGPPREPAPGLGADAEDRNPGRLRAAPGDPQPESPAAARGRSTITRRAQRSTRPAVISCCRASSSIPRSAINSAAERRPSAASRRKKTTSGTGTLGSQKYSLAVHSIEYPSALPFPAERRTSLRWRRRLGASAAQAGSESASPRFSTSQSPTTRECSPVVR